MTDTQIVAVNTAQIDKLLEAGKLAEVLDIIASQRAQSEHKPQAELKPIPKVVPVKDDDRKNLRSIIDRVSAFTAPETVRELTEAERHDVISLFDDLKKATKVLTSYEETFKTLAHNHIDCEVDAEAAKKLKSRKQPVPEVEQDKNGHYVTAGAVQHPDLSREIRRELRGGKAAPLTLADLQKLVESGDLTEAEFKSMTVQVPRQVIPASRAVSPEGVLLAMKHNPGMIQKLAKVTKLTEASTAINLRDVKSS